MPHSGENASDQDEADQTVSDRFASKRLKSLDTLRGFDMFWIVGGDMLVKSIAGQSQQPWVDAVAEQMHHAKWGHFYFYDLIFPLFMFISGAVIPYALISKLDRGESRWRLHLRVVKRAVLLVLLGLVYNGALQLEFETLRCASVLGQIGVAYFFAAVIAMAMPSARWIAMWIAAILITFAALHLLVPVPGHGAGVFSGEGCINGYIDRMLLPGTLLGKSMDPEGILCSLSAVSVTLMGVWAGMVLRHQDDQPYKKLALFFGVGVAMIAAALLLKEHYPIIKGFGTSTYNLIAGGWSFVLLGVFYFVIDVKGYQAWTLFFRVIGMNSIAIYIGAKIINFRSTSEFLLGGMAGKAGDAKPIVLILGVIIIQWCVLYFLYRKKVFLRV